MLGATYLEGGVLARGMTAKSLGGFLTMAAASCEPLLELCGLTFAPAALRSSCGRLGGTILEGCSACTHQRHEPYIAGMLPSGPLQHTPYASTCWRPCRTLLLEVIIKASSCPYGSTVSLSAILGGL